MLTTLDITTIMDDSFDDTGLNHETMTNLINEKLGYEEFTEADITDTLVSTSNGHYVDIPLMLKNLNEKIKEGMSCKYYDILHSTIRPTRPTREHLYNNLTEYLLISDPPIDYNITIDDLVEFRGEHPTEFRNAFINNVSVGVTDIDYFFKHYNYAVEAALNETIAMWVQMYWLDVMNQFSVDDLFVDFIECDFWTHPTKMATLYYKDRSEGKLYFRTDVNFDTHTRGHIQNKVIINVEEFRL